jgi:hypothetical protein
MARHHCPFWEGERRFEDWDESFESREKLNKSLFYY